ncbi:hypothetical protein OV208_11375 [Corallococcus sp. bb12-1]|uniref:hypothetical protein n=1 Tax=Corallococcus sp. bb12-1 TaxID=2996784 RepID=UPI00226DBAA7|nr:hypothetical protein [Corallococcus sp. bb12-1]MCY1041915.1 hypothetical protein [Corallococcus sp. bb12-1]
MIRSANTVEQTRLFTEARAVDAGYMTSLTVRLTLGAFTGTGVVYARYRDRVLIATARHNIEIAAALGNFQAKVRAFRDNVLIRLPGAPADVHPTTVIAPAQGAGSVYDVAVLLVRDAAFVAQVRAVVTARIGPFAEGPVWKLFRQWQGLESFTALGNLGGWWPDHDNEVINNETFRYRAGDRYHLLQVGYGRTVANNANTAGNLQTRHMNMCTPWSTIETSIDQSFPDEDEEEPGFKSLLILRASNAESTLPGDSGGPLFLLNTWNSDIHLLGTTLGSNFYEDRVDNGDDTHNNATTVVSKSALEEIAGMDEGMISA